MSFEFLKSAYSRSLGRYEFFLLEFNHPDWDKTWYFVNNNVPVTVDGQEYLGLPFKFVLNTQGETSGSAVAIANVDRRITQYLKQAIGNDDLTCKISLVHYENAGGVVKTDTEFKGEFLVTNTQIGIEQIDLSLNLRISLDFNLSTIRYNKQRFSNIYL